MLNHNRFSSKSRVQYLEELTKETFDVFIIGGGITGSGIALDAITRGLKTALVDMQDFAAGTSSRSTKLVHGGLRYLKQLEIKLVAEVGKERAIVYENGPHVTTPEWMLLPFYRNGTFGKMATSFGLKLYDYLAGVKRKERRRMLRAEAAKKMEPLLKNKELLGAGYYVEYRTDDARLTIEVLKKAVEHGAVAVNYTRVTDFIYRNGKLIGVEIEDVMTNKRYKVNARKIVNATGPWVDTMLKRYREDGGKSLLITKGVHLVFDRERFPLKQAIYFDTSDGRMIFAIPRNEKTYVGTTDTIYEDDLVHPKVTTNDREYILQAINEMFPTVQLCDDDIESSWCGLRPLIREQGKSPSEVSRKDEIWESESGLLSIAGGKLTGYRKMAETVVDLIQKDAKSIGIKQIKGCQTKKLPVSGGDVGGSNGFIAFKRHKCNEGKELGLSAEEANELIGMYGSNIDKVYSYIRKKGMTNMVLPSTIYAQLMYAIEHEMVVTPVDFFNCRTGWIYFNINRVYLYKEYVVHTMSKELKWSFAEKKAYSLELEERLKEAVKSVDL
ncbi:glycerol-3-phosphate dehydrogenase/oxidase [Bacillus timonensis]|nr:glycerol-3-phosphate dehydrogenase/oxidase [Bacillus timonensis]